MANSEVTQIGVRDLLSSDTIVMNPQANPVRVVRQENLVITHQRYGITYLFDDVVDGVSTGRARRALRYTDKVWVERQTS